MKVTDISKLLLFQGDANKIKGCIKAVVEIDSQRSTCIGPPAKQNTHQLLYPNTSTRYFLYY